MRSSNWCQQHQPETYRGSQQLAEAHHWGLFLPRTTFHDWTLGISLLLKALLYHRINQVTSLVNVWPSSLFQGHKAFTIFLLPLLSQSKDTLSVLRHDLSGLFTKPCSVLKWWVSNPPLEPTLSVSNGTRRSSNQQNIPQLKLSLVPFFHLI